MRQFKNKASTYFRMGREKFTNLLTARDANSNIYLDLMLNPRDLDMGRKVLEAFVKQKSSFDLTISPDVRFVRDQAVVYAKHVLESFVLENTSVNLFRDGIENLYFLAYSTRTRDEATGKAVGVDLCYLLDGLSPLIEIAEQACQLPITDCNAISETVNTEFVMSYVEDSEEPCVPSIKFFTLNRLLGAGGFGAVYKATLGEVLCTVKLVPKYMLPDLEHAVADKEVASMINHPCLVSYHATFSTTEAFVTVMEYIRGIDVIRLVHLSTRLSESLIRIILAQLGLALYHLHYKGFIHRDVKPANMMITVGCRVKLIDFDTAKVCMGKYTKRILTSFLQRTAREFNDGEIAGTLQYMAPEILRSMNYGRAVDWWSYGTTAYVLATGKLPVKLKPSLSFEEQKAALCSSSYSWPKGLKLSKNFQSLVKCCLDKDPSMRFCSRGYSDFSKHPFFGGVDLRWVETTNEIIKFDPINSVAIGALTYETGVQCDSPCPTPTAEAKCRRLFPTLCLTDTDQQVKLFTYFSPGFKDASWILHRGEVPEKDVIRVIPELVDFNETTQPFFFSNTTEAT